ncbi:MAG: DNA cytosine methyltransferase [Mucilaginibacter sp.]|uniref:DNA cytosine methyltransferase n=1 Tax=Mucilaginibacter sp. TaxID=1882438 RepID=UPI0031B3D899
MKSDLPEILSFFTGGGFMDMGFEKAGFNVVWSNEYDHHFAQLFSHGITSWKNAKGITGKFQITNEKSIKDITEQEIVDEAFGGQLPKEFGIIGGPPCQDFSINGNLEGFKGDRGSLTDAYLCKILDLQPSFFIMENVTGLVKVKKNAKHFFHLLDIMRELYLIDFSVLNSLDFGVPQSRERVFVVGINKKKYNLDSIITCTDGTWFPFPAGTKTSLEMDTAAWPEAQAFGLVPAVPEGIAINLCVESCLVPSGQENVVSNANEYFNLKIPQEKLAAIKEGETNRPSFKRLHRYKYSPTTCYGNNEVHLHPYQHRRLSVREALRIQSVEDSYALPPELPLSKKFKMIGNGVPVLMANALAESLARYLRRLTKT